jgi:hypothetical protein
MKRTPENAHKLIDLGKVSEATKGDVGFAIDTSGGQLPYSPGTINN